MSAFSSLMNSARFDTHLYGQLVLNRSGVNLGYFACVRFGKIAPPNRFLFGKCYFCYDQQSDEMVGDEEDQNGLYGGNSNADDCVSHMQPGDEEDP